MSEQISNLPLLEECDKIQKEGPNADTDSEVEKLEALDSSDRSSVLSDGEKNVMKDFQEVIEEVADSATKKICEKFCNIAESETQQQLIEIAETIEQVVSDICDAHPAVKEPLNILMSLFDRRIQTETTVLFTNNSELRKRLVDAQKKMIDKEVHNNKNLQLLHEENCALRNELCDLRMRYSKLEREYRYCADHPSKKEIKDMRERLDRSESRQRALYFMLEKLKIDEQILKTRAGVNEIYGVLWNDIFPKIEGQPPPPEEQVIENLKCFEETLEKLQNITIEDIQKMGGLDNSLNIQELDTEDVHSISVPVLLEKVRNLRKQLVQEKMLHLAKQELVYNMVHKFDDIKTNCMLLLKDRVPSTPFTPRNIPVVDTSNGEEDVQKLKAELHTKEELLRQKEVELAALQNAHRECTKLSEEIALLRDQVKVYEEDFNIEREAKESLSAEKNIMNQEISHLKYRNQELIQRLEVQKAMQKMTTQLLNDEKAKNAGESPSKKQPPPLPPKDGLQCIIENCDKTCATPEELQYHVYNCIENQDRSPGTSTESNADHSGQHQY